LGLIQHNWIVLAYNFNVVILVLIIGESCIGAFLLITDNQMSRIQYNYYYINSVSKDYDDSQWNGTAEDSITPQE
jgi:hypothetical protein